MNFGEKAKNFANRHMLGTFETTATKNEKLEAEKKKLEKEIAGLKANLKNIQDGVSMDSHRDYSAQIENLERMIAEAEKRQLEVSGNTAFKV